MRIVVLPRGKGKTRKLIEWMCEKPRSPWPSGVQRGKGKGVLLRVYVGHSRDAAMNAYRAYKRMKANNPSLPNLESRQFITVEEIRVQPRPGYREVYEYGFDNADMILANFCRNGKLGMVTFTGSYNKESTTVLNNTGVHDG